MNYFGESESSKEQSQNRNDNLFEATLLICNPIYMAYFYKRLLSNGEENHFFDTTCISYNLFEKVISMCISLGCCTQVQLKVVHFVDRFYKVHHRKCRSEYNEQCKYDPEYASTNSWSDVIKRIKRQMPLRVMCCIYLIMKYENRYHAFSVKKCLEELKKYGHSVSDRRFNKSLMRIMGDTDWNFRTFTLLDCVTILQTILKNNMMPLNLEFYFPHIYSVIYLIYSCEFQFNDNEIFINHSRTFLIYACLTIDLIAVLTRHPNTLEIFNELISITCSQSDTEKVVDTEVTAEKLLNLRLKYLNLILTKRFRLKW